MLNYLDPTAGSMAFQIAIGGIVSAAAALRMYRAALGRLLRRALGRPASPPPQAE